MQYHPLKMLVIIIMTLVSCATNPNRQDYDKLAMELQTLLDSLDGEAGLYVEHLSEEYRFGIHADTVFPTASVMSLM